MEDYLQYTECIPKAKCNGLIYTEWPADQLQGLWIYEHGLNWICIYQQKMNNSKFIYIGKDQRKTAILKSILRGGIHHQSFKQWIDNFQMEPRKFFSCNCIKILEKEHNSVNKHKVINSFINMYIHLINELQTINQIDFNSIKIKVCLYIFVYIII